MLPSRNKLTNIVPTAQRLLCRLFGHCMRYRKCVGSVYFKLAPELEWERKVTKEPWYGTICKRCGSGTPNLTVYANDGTLLGPQQIVEFYGTT